MPRTVLAIDPGSNKCGMALVRREENDKLTLLWRVVIPREQALAQLKVAEEVAPFSMVVIGRGTSSKALVDQLREELPSVGILLVDERDTTIEARARYWEFNPRKGWRRFLPATMQMPPEPVDDFAAYVLAERVLLTH